MVNPYIALQAELPELEKTKNEIKQEYQVKFNRLLREMNSALGLIDLRIKAINESCTHTTEDFHDASHSDYNLGGHLVEKTCWICKARLK